MRHTVVLLGALLTASCGSSDGSPAATPVSPTPQVITVNGSYSGDIVSFPGPGRMTWVLSQTGPSVAGTVAAATPEAGVVARGSLSGTLSASTLQFSIVVPAGNIADNPACAATITGIGDVTASRISALYSGIATCAGVFNGEFALNKE